MNEIDEQYVEGLITDGERYNKVIDIWAKVGELVSKALMEGISMNLRLIGDHLTKLDTPLKSIIAGGGFTRSAAWLQVFANVMQSPVHVRPSGEASAIGAAFMAMQALNIPVTAPDQAENERIITPDLASQAAYESLAKQSQG